MGNHQARAHMPAGSLTQLATSLATSGSLAPFPARTWASAARSSSSSAPPEGARASRSSERTHTGAPLKVRPPRSRGAASDRARRRPLQLCEEPRASESRVGAQKNERRAREQEIRDGTVLLQRRASELGHAALGSLVAKSSARIEPQASRPTCAVAPHPRTKGQQLTLLHRRKFGIDEQFAHPSDPRQTDRANDGFSAARARRTMTKGRSESALPARAPFPSGRGAPLPLAHLRARRSPARRLPPSRRFAKKSNARERAPKAQSPPPRASAFLQRSPALLAWTAASAPAASCA